MTEIIINTIIILITLIIIVIVRSKINTSIHHHDYQTHQNIFINICIKATVVSSNNIQDIEPEVELQFFKSDIHDIDDIFDIHYLQRIYDFCDIDPCEGERLLFHR